MLYFFTPYSLEKNLARAYNDYCRLVPLDQDWIALVDADTMFLRPDFGHQIQEVINLHPQTGLFTCYTNRVGNKHQRYPEMWNVRDILVHRKVATDIQKKHRTHVIPMTGVISGHLMIFQKKTWKDAGGFNENRQILGVDNDFSRKILSMGKKILLMSGVYMLHYYRMEEGRTEKSHLL